MKELKDLTEQEFNLLRDNNVLKSMYPECEVDTYQELKNIISRPQLLSHPNFSNLILTTEAVIDDYITKGYSKDVMQYVFEETMKALYGKNIFNWINANTK